jgi:hypothetical protein
MKIFAYIVILILMIIGGVIGLLIGKATASAETVTKTVTKAVILEKPVYDADKLPKSSEVFYFDIPLSESLQRYMYEICADEDVPITLVLAVIENASQFNADAVSSTHDYGLMQINEINHEWLREDYRCADMLNPYQNVYCGIKIISEYVHKYEKDYNKALMAYAMGEYGATKAWEEGLTSTKYSTETLALMNKYEVLLHDKKS